MRSKKTIKNGIESFTVFLLIRLFRGISRHNGILISRWLAMAAYAIFRLKGVFVDFFGKKANTPIGPIRIAKRYDVPIIPAFMHLEKDLTYRLECFEPLRLSFTGDKHQDVIADARNCNAVYEQVIRRHPEQWAWMHRRWRRRPRANPNGVE